MCDRNRVADCAWTAYSGYRGGRWSAARRRAPWTRPCAIGHARGAIALAVLGTLLMLGCAARVPQDIRTPAPAPVTAAAVRAAPERYVGTPVRWGGRILAVRNDAANTDIELLAWPLDAAGEPAQDSGDDARLGRFIARFDGFLDPATYPEGRLLTVSGTVTGVETHDVGDYPYRYPVVRATGRHLWAKPESVRAPYPSPWYDPWYGGWPGSRFGPWYGPGFGPWHRPWYW